MKQLHISCISTGATHAKLSIQPTGWPTAHEAFEQSLDDVLPAYLRDIEQLSIAFAARFDAVALSRILLLTVRNLALDGAIEVTCGVEGESLDVSHIERVFGITLKSRSAGLIRFERAKDTAGECRPGLVSILIAAWNPRYFEKALRSALAQSYSSIEILVGDDRSDDQIEKIVNRYCSAEFPVYYHRNNPRLMVRANYEACFDRSHGEFIKYLNDDDVLEPHCVERMVHAFACEPTATLVTSARALIDDRGGPKQDMPATKPLVPEDAFIDGPSLANALLLLGLNFVGEPSTVMFRRKFARLGDEPLFDFSGEFGRGITDFVLWSKLLCRGDAVYLRERLSSFRVHAEQRQALPEVRLRAIESIPALRSRWFDLGGHLSLPPSLLRTRRSQSNAFSLQPIESFGATEANKLTLFSQWAERTHPFFLSNS